MSDEWAAPDYIEFSATTSDGEQLHVQVAHYAEDGANPSLAWVVLQVRLRPDATQDGEKG